TAPRTRPATTMRVPLLRTGAGATGAPVHVEAVAAWAASLLPVEEPVMEAGGTLGVLVDVSEPGGSEPGATLGERDDANGAGGGYGGPPVTTGLGAGAAIATVPVGAAGGGGMASRGSGAWGALPGRLGVTEAEGRSMAGPLERAEPTLLGPEPE